MDDDDEYFFTRLDHGDNAFQNRLRSAPRDNDDPGDVPMPLLEDEEQEIETPLQRIIRHWMNERHAPDILPVAEDVLSGLLDHIRRQVGEITMRHPVRARMLDIGLAVRHRPAVALRSVVL